MKRLFFTLPVLVLLASCNRPMADFSHTAGKRTAPAKVQFENKSQKAVSYLWDFGDGHTSEEPSPTHTYYSSGNHTIQLKAMNGDKVGIKKQHIFIEQPLDCLVLIETSLGNMTVALYNATPQHRDNFVKLAEEGYFDGLLFHRVIEGFMVQGGDPNSRNAAAGQALGMGGPSYTVAAEFVDSLIHAKGVIAAARTGGPSNPEKRSSGSQFYIVQGKVLSNAELDAIESQKGIRYSPEQRAAYTTLGGTPFLDREYTVFGRVIEGLEVIDKIAAVPTGANDRPEQDVKMKIKVIK